MKHGFLKKTACFTIIISQIWTTTWAMSQTPQNYTYITVEDLERQYPGAHLYSVTPEEFRKASIHYRERSIPVDQTEINTRYPSPALALQAVPTEINSDDKSAPYSKTIQGSELQSIDKLLFRYQNLHFQATDLNSLNISRTYFLNNVLLIAFNLSPDTAITTGELPVEKLKQDYPDLKFLALDWQAFIAARSASGNRIVVIARAEKVQADEVRTDSPDHDDSNGQVHVRVESGLDLPDLPSDDEAIILFVIIGIIVVAVLIVYAGKYVYDLVINKGKGYEYWLDASLQTIFMDRKTENGVEETGALSGIRLSTGFKDKNTHIGISGEFGNMNITHKSKTDKDKLEGNYWLAGPAIRWYFGDYNPNYFTLEFLGGTAEDRRIGIISTAKAGINWGVREHLRFGLNIGSLYMDMTETEGIIKQHDDFRLTLGFELGYRF